jgi:uncharacterized protein
MNESAPPRLVPDSVFPPYSYVPGRFPHPISDPKGHSFGIKPPPSELPDPNGWRECRPYMVGLDLFNHGYYWEAHEVWESLWHACGRKGPTADFLKGLIKLAAAGVKARQGEPRGLQNHALRAAELFAKLKLASQYMGFGAEQLIRWAEDAARIAPVDPANGDKDTAVVFPFWLLPR